MLNELTELQQSDEIIWGMSRVSFEIQTRLEESNEIIERSYTFSYAPEWDKWSFVEFEERKAEDVKLMSNREWRTTRRAVTTDSGPLDIDVPPEVSEQLEELLDLESVVLQTP